MKDLALLTFEHYPYDPCRIPWSSLSYEPELIRLTFTAWHEDGLPADIPMFITEGNLSSAASENYQDMFSGLWLADYVGSLLDAGAKGVYFFHYLPLQMEPGCNSSPGTFGMFTVDAEYKIQQPLAQFFVAQLINLEWAQAGGGEHQVYSAKSDIEDGAGRDMVTAYALKRPDGEGSLMIVNRAQENGDRVPVAFRGKFGKATEVGKAGSGASLAGPAEIATFGSAQYKWNPP